MMWIRSQSGNDLICARHIGLRRDSSRNRFCLYELSQRTTIELGEYSSEEKAMEVISEIQLHLEYAEEYRTIRNDINGTLEPHIRKNTHVFYMPSDEDVEV